MGADHRFLFNSERYVPSNSMKDDWQYVKLFIILRGVHHVHHTSQAREGNYEWALKGIIFAYLFILISLFSKQTVQ